MGIDAYVATPLTNLTPDEVRTITESSPYFSVQHAWFDINDEPTPILEWCSGTRWFDEHYKRGYWPAIREAIMTLREYADEIYYVGDGEYDYATVITNEEIEKLDAAWDKKVKEEGW